MILRPLQRLDRRRGQARGRPRLDLEDESESAILEPEADDVLRFQRVAGGDSAWSAS